MLDCPKFSRTCRFRGGGYVQTLPSSLDGPKEACTHTRQSEAAYLRHADVAHGGAQDAAVPRPTAVPAGCSRRGRPTSGRTFLRLLPLRCVLIQLRRGGHDLLDLHPAEVHRRFPANPRRAEYRLARLREWPCGLGSAVGIFALLGPFLALLSPASKHRAWPVQLAGSIPPFRQLQKTLMTYKTSRLHTKARSNAQYRARAPDRQSRLFVSRTAQKPRKTQQNKCLQALLRGPSQTTDRSNCLCGCLQLHHAPAMQNAFNTSVLCQSDEERTQPLLGLSSWNVAYLLQMWGPISESSDKMEEVVYLAGAQQLQLRAADVMGRAMAPPGKHPEYQQVQAHCVDYYKDAGSPADHYLSSFMAQAAGLQPLACLLQQQCI